MKIEVQRGRIKPNANGAKLNEKGAHEKVRVAYHGGGKYNFWRGIMVFLQTYIYIDPCLW